MNKRKIELGARATFLRTILTITSGTTSTLVEGMIDELNQELDLMEHDAVNEEKITFDTWLAAWKSENGVDTMQAVDEITTARKKLYSLDAYQTSIISVLMDEYHYSLPDSLNLIVDKQEKVNRLSNLNWTCKQVANSLIYS